MLSSTALMWVSVLLVFKRGSRIEYIPHTCSISVIIAIVVLAQPQAACINGSLLPGASSERIRLTVFQRIRLTVLNGVFIFVNLQKTSGHINVSQFDKAPFYRRTFPGF